MKDIIRLIEKSVMLLDQANNKVAYFRRLSILNVLLNSKSDAKGILNAYAPLLSTKSIELFVCQFRCRGKSRPVRLGLFSAIIPVN